MHYIKSSTLKLSPRASRICPLVVMIFIISLMSRLLACYRNSRLEVFYKKGVLKNFGKFTGKRQCNFINKETLAQVFPCEFSKISQNTFSYRTPPPGCF